MIKRVLRVRKWVVGSAVQHREGALQIPDFGSTDRG
jgi:hypothetical protein